MAKRHDSPAKNSSSKINLKITVIFFPKEFFKTFIKNNFETKLQNHKIKARYLRLTDRDLHDLKITIFNILMLRLKYQDWKWKLRKKIWSFNAQRLEKDQIQIHWAEPHNAGGPESYFGTHNHSNYAQESKLSQAFI